MKSRIWAIAALALVGLGVSVHQSSHFYALRSGTAGFKSFCNISEAMNCDVVASSRYAELFAGFPLSSFAAAWFLAIFLVALFTLSMEWRREGARSLTFMTGFGVLMSVVFLYIMAAVLKTYCLECLVVDAVNVASFALALSLKPTKAGSVDSGQWKTFAGMTAGSLLFVVIMLKGFQTIPVNTADEEMIAADTLSRSPMAIGAGPELPSIGPANAPVTIVKFMDFQCPSCRLGATMLHTLSARYPEKVRVVLRNYPLDGSCNPKMQGRGGHPQACEAAKVATCAHDQGKYREVYETLFENQEAMKSKAPLAMAKEVAGVDAAKLEACVAAPETSHKILRDINEGETVGVQGTPTYFVNGRRLMGFPTIGVWSRIVDKLAP